jgi:Protein of unknown function (DUF3987)
MTWDTPSWREAAADYHEAREKTNREDAARKRNGRASTDDNHASGTEKAKAPLHDWENPDWSILDDRRGDLPDFPVDCLGGKLKEWVKRAARGAGVTPAHVAVPALGIASSLIGMARRVKASKSWLEPMTCWTGIVGMSGTGKTPGIDTIKRVLAQIERDGRKGADELRRAHDGKAENAKAARDKWRQQVKEAVEANVPAPSMPEAATDPGKFVAPRLYVSDGTIERFGELLQARPQGVLRLTDELSAMFMNMSRYSGGQDNEFWLECWNGHSYNVERIGRTLHIDHLLIGVVGGFQPDKLAKSFEGPADGMYARILFAWPPEPVYRALDDDALEIDPAIQNALGRLNKLAEFADGNLVSREIGLSKDAREEFERFRQFAHREKEAVDGREREWLAKTPAHVLRLAGTLCLFEWAMQDQPTPEPPSEISADHVEAAVSLVKGYFWPHTQAALRQIGLSERHINARRALRWIRARGKRQVSREDIRRDALGQRLDADQTASLIDALDRAGWLREIKTESGPKGGRPARRWETNPLIKMLAAETAQTAQTPGGGEVSAVPAVSASKTQIRDHASEGVDGPDDGGLPAFLDRTKGNGPSTWQSVPPDRRPALGPPGDSLHDFTA